MMQTAPLRLAAALGFFLVSACTHNRPSSIAPPTFPDTISAEQRDELYAAHALVCSEGRCSRDDGAYDLEVLGPQAYTTAKQELKRHNDLESTAQTIGFSTSGLAFATAAVFTMVSSAKSTDYLLYGRRSDADAADRTLIAAGSCYALGAAIAIITAFLPHMMGGPDDEFEAAYNEALASDLDGRVAPGTFTEAPLTTP